MKKLMILFFAVTFSAFAQTPFDDLVANRFEAAREGFAADMDRDELARLGWFLTHVGNGPTDELRESALTILRRYPDSGTAEFVLKVIDPFSECMQGFEEEVGDLVEGRQTANPELRSLYASALRARARNRAETPDFFAETERAGFLTAWRLSPRIGKQGVPAQRRVHPPEKAAWWAENGYEERTKTGVVAPPRESHGAGVVYAFSQFENPVKQRVVFRLFSYQNVNLYLDGKLLGAYKHLESLDAHIRFLALDVPAGRHEVMIKTSQTRGNNGQFSLMITADQAPTFLLPDRPQHDLGGAYNNVEEPVMGLAAQLKDDPSDLSGLVKAILAIHHKDTQTAIELLEDLNQRYPGSRLVGGILAKLYLKQVEFLSSDDQLGRSFQILSTLAQQEEDYNLENKLSFALLLIKARQTKPALELMNQIVQANPGYCDALEARLILSREEALHDVRRETRDLIEAKGPNHRWALKQLLGEAQREENLDKTRDLLTRLSDLLPWEGYVARLHEMNQDYEAAIVDLKKRGDIFSDRDYYPFAISQDYAKLGNRTAQREWLERTLSVNPAHREALLNLVNLDCFEGKKEAARRRLLNYLKVSPADAFFRQRLSHLDGATAFDPFRVDAEEVIEAAKNKPISQGADSELLLDQLMVRLFEDGSQMRYTHLVTRVLTKDGVDQESELRLPEDLEILELRTVKADGNVYYPESFANKSTISLSGISVGDFIDEEHIEYLPPAYYDEDGLDSAMTFIFQGVDRIYHHSELVLIYPESLTTEPQLLSRNMPVEPQVEIKDGLKYVRWLTRDMPPLEVEPAMPPLPAIQPTASFYYNTTWPEIRDFYYNAVRPRMGLSTRLKEQAAVWRKKADGDPAKMVDIVYQDISDGIERESQFYKNVNLVWETRTGNPTLLMAAVFEELGIPCDIVFVQSKDVLKYTFDFPRPGFSYALLRVEVGGKTRWLDPNHKGLKPGYVPFTFRGSRGLVLTLDKDMHVDIPTFDDATERVEASYALYFRPDGSVNGDGSEKFYGLFASQLEEHYVDLNKPELKQRVEAGINQTFPGTSVSKVEINESLPRGEFELTNQFYHPELAKVEQDGAVIKVPFLLPDTPLLERYGGLPERKTAIHLAMPHYNVSTMTLMLPEGYTWDALPGSQKLESRFGTYTLDIKRVEDRKIQIKRVYHLPAGEIAPEDYREFLAFCRGMNEIEVMEFQAQQGPGSR